MTFFIKKLVRRPELIFRPLQIIKRLKWIFSKNTEAKKVSLPWGMKINACPRDRIGSSILKTGTYDTVLLECLSRLINPGEICLDIGANHGLMTSLMAKSSGLKGEVIAFEAHPEIFSILKENVSDWLEGHSISKIKTENLAVSNHIGNSELFITNEFESNQGSASMSESCDSNEIKDRINVKTITLDTYFADIQEYIGVCKLDIEGHEKAALDGAKELLKQKKIRDIVYEDHTSYPSPVSDLLEHYGYKIFFLRKGLFKPLLLSPNTVRYELPNYLATIDPDRAIGRFNKFGYQTL